MGRRSLNIGDRMKRKLEEMEMWQKQATKKMNPAHLQLDDSDSEETYQDDDGREMGQSNGKLMKLTEDDKDEDTEGEDDEESKGEDNKEAEEDDEEFEDEETEEDDEEFEDEETEEDDEEFEDEETEEDDEESEDDDEDSDDNLDVRRGMTATFVHSSEFLQSVREELQDMTERENKILKTVAPRSYQLLMNTTNLANP